LGAAHVGWKSWRRTTGREHCVDTRWWNMTRRQNSRYSCFGGVVFVCLTMPGGSYSQVTEAGASPDTDCVTSPPVEAFLRRSLDRAVRVAFGRQISRDATLCWELRESAFITKKNQTNYPVASTIPTYRNVGDFRLAEWYELDCIPGRTGWDCNTPRRLRQLRLEHPVMLNSSVSDDLLPRLVGVLEELKRIVPSSRIVKLPECRFDVVHDVDLGTALARVGGASVDTDRHTFDIAMPGDGGTLVLTVPYDQPLTIEHLCGGEFQY
jgi:hypothetical protein